MQFTPRAPQAMPDALATLCHEQVDAAQEQSRQRDIKRLQDQQYRTDRSPRNPLPQTSWTDWLGQSQ